MPNTLAVAASLGFTGPNNILSKTLGQTASPTVTGKNFLNEAALVPFAAPAAIPLGNLSNLGWIMIVNRDPTNFIKILTGTGGVIFAKLLPGEPCVLRAGSGVTAPFWQADTADAEAEILAVEI